MEFLFRIYTKVPVGFESLFHLNDNHAPVYAKYFGAKARGNSTCGGTMSITRFTIFLCICTVTFTPKCPRFYLTFTLPHPMFTRSQNMQYRARGAGFADEIVDSCRLSMHCLGF